MNPGPPHRPVVARHPHPQPPQPLHPSHLQRHHQPPRGESPGQGHGSAQQSVAGQSTHHSLPPEVPPPGNPPFRLKFRTSIFSKYQECIIKPLLPRPKPKPKEAKSSKLANGNDARTTAVGVHQKSASSAAAGHDKQQNMHNNRNPQSSQGGGRVGGLSSQTNGASEQRTRIPEIRIDAQRNPLTVGGPWRNNVSMGGPNPGVGDSDWTVSRQYQGRLGMSSPSQTVGGGGGCGDGGVSTLKIPQEEGDGGSEAMRRRGGRGGGRGGRGGGGRGLTRQNSSVKKRKKSVAGPAHLKLDENEILQMYREDGELAEEPGDADSGLTLVERIGEQKDIVENVKFQPWPIAKKLQVLRLAQSFVVRHEGDLSRGLGYQQKGRQLLKQLKRSWNNFEYWATPWEIQIKRIESHFGSVVTSYFIFLRWMLWINLWLTVVQLCFVIVPEVIVGPDYGTTEGKTIPEDEKATAYDLKTIWDAEGVMRYSPLFYGYYGNADVIGNGYRLPLAYLLTTLSSFAYSFIVVLKKMASNSRQSRMSNKDEQFTFSWKLFSDWDFMVGNPETATTKHASIVTTMKESIVEEQEKKQEEKNYLLVFLRVLANVIIVLLLALSTYVIYLFVERSRELELQDSGQSPGFWAANELTIIMTMISTLFPNILDLISLMEKYHPRTTLRLTLARIFILNLINLYTLFIALYNKQSDLKNRAITSTSQCALPVNLTTVSVVLSSATTTTTALASSSANAVTTIDGGFNLSAASANCSGNSSSTPVSFCWETMIGQEVFKLTVMDTIFTLGQIFVIDVIRTIFVKHCNNICCWDLQKKFPEYPDFKTAENLLHLINNQGVIWLGAFFSPGLAVLNLLKLLLLMYVRCWTVLACNVPQERIFRASRSNNFYFALLLVMLFLCMLPPLFAIVGIKPSPTCGPFSGLDQIYKVATKTMETELPSGMNSILDYAASPGVILPIFMLLGMTIYYLVSVGRSLREANNELRMMLEYERTEGRKKVYAMAETKRGDGDINPASNTKMVSAVSSVLKAAQMSRVISSLTGQQQKRKPQTSVAPPGGDSPAGQKVAPAVRPKPHVPVAVVQGKRSLKRSAVALLHKAVATRHTHQQQQNNHHHQQGGGGGGGGGRGRGGGKRNPTMAVTNGRMTVATSSSADTADISSNDEDDDDDDANDDDEDAASSYGSSQSSGGHRDSHHHQQQRLHDDPSRLVDDTGHLRPVTQGEVVLDMESSEEEGENEVLRGGGGDFNNRGGGGGRGRPPRDGYYNDAFDDDRDHTAGGGGSSNRYSGRGGDPHSRANNSAVTPSRQTRKQRKNASARPPPVRPKPGRSRGKKGQSGSAGTIPRITVVDFGLGVEEEEEEEEEGEQEREEEGEEEEEAVEGGEWNVVDMAHTSSSSSRRQHVEPLVTVESETTKNRRNRAMNLMGAAAAARRTRNAKKTGGGPRASAGAIAAADSANAEDFPHSARTQTLAPAGRDDSEPKASRGPLLTRMVRGQKAPKTAAKTRFLPQHQTAGTQQQQQQQQAGKASSGGNSKFSHLLERFQNLDESG